MFVTRQHTWAELLLGGGCRCCSVGIEGRKLGVEAGACELYFAV